MENHWSYYLVSYNEAEIIAVDSMCVCINGQWTLLSNQMHQKENELQVLDDAAYFMSQPFSFFFAKGLWILMGDPKSWVVEAPNQALGTRCYSLPFLPLRASAILLLKKLAPLSSSLIPGIASYPKFCPFLLSL